MGEVFLKSARVQYNDVIYTIDKDQWGAGIVELAAKARSRHYGNDRFVVVALTEDACQLRKVSICRICHFEVEGG